MEPIFAPYLRVVSCLPGNPVVAWAAGEAPGRLPIAAR